MTGRVTPFDLEMSEVRLKPESVMATISSMFCELEIVSGRHPLGLVRQSKIGDMVLLQSLIQTGRFATARSDRLIRRSTTEAFLLGMTVKGSPSIRQQGHDAPLSPGEMVLIDSRRRFELEITDETELICLKIPCRSVETRIVEHGRYLGLPLKTEHGLGYVVGKMFEACVATSPFIGPSDGRRLEGSFVDMMGSAFRHQVGAEEDRGFAHAYKVFNRLKEYIEENLDDPMLSPSLISSKFGLSERYIRKMFAARGATPMSWIRTRRLQRCHRAISDGAGDYASVAEIAYAHGFNDISSFNRSFKTEFGVTPSDVRQASRRAS